MANEEQLVLLRQGVDAWNAWRKENPNAEVDLKEADLSQADLRKANLIKAKFNRADLSEANLSQAKLYGADLSRAYLISTDLNGANLSQANLCEANLVSATLFEAKLILANLNKANFSFANLSKAILHEANLNFAALLGTNFVEAELMGANLRSTKLVGANLCSAKLDLADLSDANLQMSQVFNANFTYATLTGACIAHCSIGDSTILDGIKCDYIFRTYSNGKFSGRLPVDPKSTFAPGEFTQRFQIIASVLETIDITFTDGIDWQAFFQSFQDLRRQRPDQDISIQGMERKGQAFIVRLEVEANVDKAAIETQIKQLYANQLATLEAQYEKQLKLQGIHLEDARRTIEKERQEKATLMGIMATMAENQVSKYDMRGTQFAGGFAETVNGNQIGGIINNYGQKTDDILRLLTSLRDLSQTFPDEQKIEAEMELDALEADLNKPEKPEPKRLGKHIKRLIAAGTAAATIVGGAVTFSDNLNQFTDNVFELGEKLGLTREDIQN